MDPAGQPAALSEPAFALLPIAHATRARGVDVQAPLTAAGLGALDALAPHDRLPVGVAVQIWRLAARLGGAFAVHVAATIAPERTESPLAMYGAVAPTLGESARRLVEVSAAGSQLVRWHLEVEAADWWLVATPTQPPCPGLAACMEYMVADAVTVGRWQAGQPIPMDVDFAHAARGATAEIAAFFGGTVRFGAGRTAIHVPPAVQATPCLRADATLSAWLGGRVRATLADLAATLTRDRLRPFIRAGLPQGPPSLEAAAAEIAASPSTLQRRLRAEGTSYRDLVDEIRRDRAFELLLQPDAQIGEVAYFTGFSDPRAFTRAFRRWTGRAPSAWRGPPAPASGGGSGAGTDPAPPGGG